MDGNQKDIDTAKVKRQIGGCKSPTDQQHYILKYLIGNKQNCNGLFPATSTLLAQCAIPNATCNRYCKEECKPQNMHDSKMGKTNTGRNRSSSIQKILQQFYPISAKDLHKASFSAFFNFFTAISLRKAALWSAQVSI